MSSRPKGWQPARPAPAPAPTTLPIARSLGAAGPLASLLERVRASQARLDAVRGMVPAMLRPHLGAGPLDETGWTLMAANAAVAAKLMHVLPLIQEGLAEQGWEALPIRVRVKGAGDAPPPAVGPGPAPPGGGPRWRR